MDCIMCGKELCSKASLKGHIRRKHPFVKIDLVPQFSANPLTVPPPKASLVCDICSKSFTSKLYVRYHKRKVHAMPEFQTKSLMEGKTHEQSRRKCSYKCFGCSKTFHNKGNITRHFAEQHDLVINTQEVIFKNHNEFIKWKLCIEKKTASFYFLSRRYTTKTTVFHSYECNCGGEYKSKSTGKRHIKSRKSGSYCPARMLYSVPVGGGDINVNFTSTHVGHQCQYSHLRIPKPDKDFIAEQLRSGVPTEEILQKVSETISEPSRLSLLKRDDIRNIAVSYGVDVPKQNNTRKVKAVRTKKRRNINKNSGTDGERASEQRNTNRNDGTYGECASEQRDTNRNDGTYGECASEQRNSNDVLSGESWVNSGSSQSISFVKNDSIDTALYTSSLRDEANLAMSRAVAALDQNFSKEKCEYFIDALETMMGNMLAWGNMPKPLPSLVLKNQNLERQRSPAKKKNIKQLKVGQVH